MSLTCICCKTLEHIIVSKINKHLALESILADCQHGFRSQRSCETQLVQFYHDLVSNLDRAVNSGHKQTDVIVMDFAKAFDKVPHKRLLYKLDFYGIRGSTHKWIDSWLSERSQKVVLDGRASDPVPAPRHTKEVAYKTLFRPHLEYAAPIWHPYHETQTEKVEKVQKTAARWTCRRWRNSRSVGDMLDELEWPSLQSRRERSSLTFFYKIHSGTVSLDKDKYLTPAPNLRRTRASHELQYTRQFAYSDALKKLIFP